MDLPSITFTQFQSPKKPYGAPHTVQWADFLRDFRTPACVWDKDSRCDGWSPAIFEDNHRKKNGAREVYAVVLDYDGGAYSVEQAEWLLRGFTGVIHSTYQHTTDAPRWRAILLPT